MTASVRHYFYGLAKSQNLNFKEFLVIKEIPCLFKHFAKSIIFYLYNYPPDLLESVGGAIHRATVYSDLFSEIPKYSCPVENFFFRDMTEIWSCLLRQRKISLSFFPQEHNGASSF